MFGGGVSGLVTGLALSSVGCEVHIYEQYDTQSSSYSGDLAFLVTEELQQFLKACNVPLVSIMQPGQSVYSPIASLSLLINYCAP